MIRKLPPISVEEPSVRDWMPKVEEWNGIKTVTKVESHTESAKNGGLIRVTCYFLTYINRCNKIILKILINYWGVETACQHLDVAFREIKRKI